MDPSGIWLGSDKFATAPFRVAMDGTMTISGASGFGDLAWENSANLDTQVTDGATYKKTTVNEKTGAGRGYSALNSSNRYAQWLSAGEMALGSTPSTGVVFDSLGIRGYKSGTKNFEITSVGDAYFRGDIYAINGTFTGSITSSATITGGTITGGTLKTGTSYGYIEMSDQSGLGMLQFRSTFENEIHGRVYLKDVAGTYDFLYIDGLGPYSGGSGIEMNGDVWMNNDLHITGVTYCGSKFQLPVGTNLY
jgi:hypothetical protein